MFKIKEKAVVIHNLCKFSFDDFEWRFFIEIAAQILIVVVVRLQMVEFNW